MLYNPHNWMCDTLILKTQGNYVTAVNLKLAFGAYVIIMYYNRGYENALRAIRKINNYRGQFQNLFKFHYTYNWR